MKRAAHILLAAALLAVQGIRLQAQEERRAVVIPVSFSDCSISTTEETIDSLLAELSKYCTAQFLGKTAFVFDRAPAATLDNPYSYYGANSTDRRDSRAEEMAKAACTAVNADVDFSLYAKTDGTFNSVILLTAGVNERAAMDQTRFWPQYITPVSKYLFDRCQLGGFAIVPEYCTADSTLTGIGIYAHEFGHILGLKDMYDTDEDASGGVCRGLQSVSLMDFGMENDGGNTPPNLNAIERDLLGCGECTVIDATGEHSLEPIHLQGRYCLLPTKVEGRCYMIENRAAEGYDAHIGGSGMLIYRVDRSTEDAGWSTYFRRTLSALERWRENQVNCNPDFPCAGLVRAVDDPEDFSKVFWPQDDADSFYPGPYAITHIQRDAGGTVSFKVIEPVRIDGITVFQSSATVAWRVSADIGPLDSVKVEWSHKGTVVGSAHGISAGENKYNYTIRGLNPRTAYNCTATAWCSDGNVYSAEGSFTTRIYRTGLFRFIYLGDTPRADDGTFAPGTKMPLVVYNSLNEQVEWKFRGRSISAGSDGLWEIPRSGTLKAEVTLADGSKEILTKYITVK